MPQCTCVAAQVAGHASLDASVHVVQSGPPAQPSERHGYPPPQQAGAHAAPADMVSGQYPASSRSGHQGSAAAYGAAWHPSDAPAGLRVPGLNVVVPGPPGQTTRAQQQAGPQAATPPMTQEKGSETKPPVAKRKFKEFREAAPPTKRQVCKLASHVCW
jgi:hypothetical protein